MLVLPLPFKGLIVLFYRNVTKALECLQKLPCNDGDKSFREALETLEGYVYLCSDDVRQGKFIVQFVIHRQW